MYTFCLIVILLALFLTVLNSQSGDLLQKKKPIILENVHYLTVEVMPGANASNLIFKDARPAQKENPLSSGLKKKTSEPSKEQSFSVRENPAGNSSDEVPPVPS